MSISVQYQQQWVMANDNSFTMDRRTDKWTNRQKPAPNSMFPYEAGGKQIR